jgi:phosphoribosylformimino-5-aminoimidazole carboxamide ribotide isomerase
VSRLVVIPAVDLAGGRAVRLWQGQREHTRTVADDPVALAGRLADEGAELLHLVDLDAAFGAPSQEQVIAAILRRVGCPVQVGGGVRSSQAARRLWDAGAARVVVGTMASRDRSGLDELLGDDPDRVVVAADTRAGRVVVAGWTEEGGEALEPFARRMRDAGVRHLLVTASERDGTGMGCDPDILETALAGFGAGVNASGGIGTLAHVAALRPLATRGLAGVVVGSLLVDGHASVGEVIAAAGGR